MDKLERLKKDVVDTEAAYAAAFDTGITTITSAAYATYVKAGTVLANYLKEQDNDERYA